MFQQSVTIEGAAVGLALKIGGGGGQLVGYFAARIASDQGRQRGPLELVHEQVERRASD